MDTIYYQQRRGEQLYLHSYLSVLHIQPSYDSDLADEKNTSRLRVNCEGIVQQLDSHTQES